MTHVEKRWAGIDGCKGGWILCEIQGCSVHFSFLHHLSELNPPLYEAILIDIPLSFAKKSFRSAEIEGKKRLQKRSSTLFFTPVKESVLEKDYVKALEVSRLLTGKGFSKQAFYLFPKILEAVALKESYPGIVLESHPEICFLGWKGSPAKFSKKTEEGKKERLLLIEHLSQPALAALQKAPFKKHQDDLLDALMLALTARERDRFTYLGDDREEAIVYYESSLPFS